MAYISAQTEGNRTEYSVDIVRFARDLAKVLGGRAEPSIPEYPKENQDILLNLGTYFVGNPHCHARVWLSAKCYVRDINKVSVDIGIAPLGIRDKNHYANDHKTQSVTVRPDARSIEAIAKDIQKRVILANIPALQKQWAYQAERNDAKSNLQRHARALERAWPGLKITVDQDGLSANLYIAEPYFSGRLSSDGSVTVDRMDSLKIETVVKLLGLLASAAKGE